MILIACLDGRSLNNHLPFHEAQLLTVAGLVGLSLAYALPITDRLNGLLTVSAETEQEMVAVERLTEYTHLPPQASTLHPHRAVPEQELSLPFQSKLCAPCDCRILSLRCYMRITAHHAVTSDSCSRCAVWQKWKLVMMGK